MSKNINYGFSDKTPVSRILKFMMGLNIDGRDLFELLPVIALEFQERHNRIQPTGGPLASHFLSGKFSYVVDRLIQSYHLDEEQSKIAKEHYYSIVVKLKEKKKQSDTENTPPPPDKNKLIFRLILDDKSAWQKNEITLYEYKDDRANIDAKAYFEKEDLVIDCWILSERYEDEYFIRVKKNQLKKLCRESEPTINSKSELWQFLLDNFKGENAFWDVKKYLELKGISFENSVRHG